MMEMELLGELMTGEVLQSFQVVRIEEVLVLFRCPLMTFNFCNSSQAAMAPMLRLSC
jgi:hypothetical protein